MPKELDVENLRMCIDNYEPESLFIRNVGSYGGTVQVQEELDGRALDFRKDDSGLYMIIDTEEVFHFPLKFYQKGFSLAYERFFPDGRMHIPGGIPDHPYDPELPEPERSYLRTVMDKCLMEIYFKGRINIKFHSWWEEPYWKYWTIDMPGSIQEIINKQQIEYGED